MTTTTTTTALTSSRTPALTTAPPIFTAVVASSNGVPVEGRVEFLIDGVAAGTSTLFQRGAQSVAVFGGASLDAAGSPHTVTARYLGDALHAASDSAPMLQAVRPGTYFSEVLPGIPIGFAPMAIGDNGLIAGNRGNATVSRAAAYDAVLGYRLLDSSAAFSQVFDLNAAGTIVGRLGENAATTVGFVFGNGSLTPIAQSTSAVGVNGREQVALALVDGQGAGQYQNGTVTFVDQFEPRAINDAGAIAGSLIAGDGQPDAVLWQGGAITELGRFSQLFASATHVTNDGTVLVQAGDVSGEVFPILWRNGVEIPLGNGRYLGHQRCRRRRRRHHGGACLRRRRVDDSRCRHRHRHGHQQPGQRRRHRVESAEALDAGADVVTGRGCRVGNRGR